MVFHCGIVIAIDMFKMMPTVLLVVEPLVFDFPATSPRQDEFFRIVFRDSDVRYKQKLTALLTLRFNLASKRFTLQSRYERSLAQNRFASSTVSSGD